MDPEITAEGEWLVRSEAGDQHYWRKLQGGRLSISACWLLHPTERLVKLLKGNRCTACAWHMEQGDELGSYLEAS